MTLSALVQGYLVYFFDHELSQQRGMGQYARTLQFPPPECSFLISYSLFPALSFSFSPCSIAPSEAHSLTLARVMQFACTCLTDKEHLYKYGPCLSSAPSAHQLPVILTCLFVGVYYQRASVQHTPEGFSLECRRWMVLPPLISSTM